MDKILLLEESTLNQIPETLEKLVLENTKSENSNSSQELRLLILALLTYHVVLEVGFVPESFSENAIKKSTLVPWGYDKIRITQCLQDPLPETFKSQTHFRLNIKFLNDDTQCILLMMRSGDSLFTTITSKKFKGQSLYLSAARYVPFVNKKKLSSSFRGLNDFAVEVKNKLCGPIRNCVLAEHDQIFPGLLGLPESHLDQIFQYLQLRDLKNLVSTCSYLCREVKNFRRRKNKK